MTALDFGVLAGAILMVATALHPSVRGKQSMLPTGVVLWSIAVVLQSPGIYLFVDGLLGGTNLTNLLYRTACVAALCCLHIMLARASAHRLARLRVAEIGVWLLGAAVALIQLGFFLQMPRGASDTFLADLYGNPSRELFWNVLTVAVAGFAVHVVAAIAADWRGHAVRSTRFGLLLIGAAAVTELIWTTESVITSGMRVATGTSWPGTGADPVQQTLLILMIALTAFGVAVSPAENLVDGAVARMYAVALTPIWWLGVHRAPAVSLDRQLFLPFYWSVESEIVLHRRKVEIQDAERAEAIKIGPLTEFLLRRSSRVLWGGPTERGTDIGISALLGIGGR